MRIATKLFTFILNTREEAEIAIDALDEMIDKYGSASIADLYDLVGLTRVKFTDNKFGWTSIKGTTISRTRSGYVLNLPDVVALSDTPATKEPETSELERDIASVLNKHSAENGSNTPDFILAEYLMACLKAYNTATKSTRAYQGVDYLNVGTKDT